MTMAKSLAGGMPLSGVVVTRILWTRPRRAGWVVLTPGPAGGGCRARCAQHYRQRITLERANQLGQRLTNTLIDAKETFRPSRRYAVWGL